MCAGSKIVKERQKAIRREMDRRGISLKAVAFDSGIPYATLATYFPQDPLKDPVQIPQGATFSIKQAMALPLDLMNLLQPDNVCLVEIPAEVDVHEIGRIVAELHALKTAAHHPDSPAGVEISECEARTIAAKAAELKAVA